MLAFTDLMQILKQSISNKKIAARRKTLRNYIYDFQRSRWIVNNLGRRFLFFYR